MRSMYAFGQFSLVLFAIGCGGPSTADGGGGVSGMTSEEPTAEVSEALDPNWVSGPYTWNKGGARVMMQPLATHVCVLTKVRGEFDGGAEWVNVDVPTDLSQQCPGSGCWYLSGHAASSANGHQAQAYCFKKSAFLANGSLRAVSSEYEPQFSVTDSNSSCSGNAVNAWWGDAATFLTGLQGKFDGGGERVRIVQSPGAFTNSAVVAESCAGSLTARAQSFFAGTSGNGQLAKFIGGEYVASTYTGVVEVPMAPTGEAMCYLTRVEGRFNGSGEAVTIAPKVISGTERWVLQANSTGGNNWVHGRARCYKRDQR